MKEYPDHSLSSFLICEDIRREVGNKLSLMGVYVGGNIVLSVPEQNAGEEQNIEMSSLCFYFSFVKGGGEFKAIAKVRGPSGDIVEEVDLGDIVKESPNNLVSAFRLSPFPVKGFGDYEVSYYLDDQLYKHTFQIVEASPEQ